MAAPAAPLPMQEYASAPDRVVSYEVSHGLRNYVDPAVDEALRNGYRVIDIITVPFSSSAACVTVLLSRVDEKAYEINITPYKFFMA